jgi:hypothetical protein
MQSVSSGMYAVKENMDLLLLCTRVLKKLTEEFNITRVASEPVASWFTEKQGGLELCLHAISNHSLEDIGEDLVGLIEEYIQASNSNVPKDGSQFLQDGHMIVE